MRFIRKSQEKAPPGMAGRNPLMPLGKRDDRRQFHLSTILSYVKIKNERDK